MDLIQKAFDWWHNRNQRAQLVAIRRFVFNQALNNQYKGTLQIITPAEDGSTSSQWEIFYELNPTFPDSLVKDWEEAKEKALQEEDQSNET